MSLADGFATALSEAGLKIGTAAREIAQGKAASPWVQRFIYGEIAQRANTRGLFYWDEIFPDLSPEERAEARIRRMLRRATVAGVAGAAGASVAELLSIGSDGAVAPLAIPLGLASMGAELLYTTALQVDLAFDLASIYGVPFAGDDIGEISTLLALPLGIDLVQEPTRHDKPGDDDETKPWRVIRQMQRDDFAMQIGRELLQQTVLRDALPVVGVLISGLWNQVSLRRFARAVDMSMRHRRALVKACTGIHLGDARSARTILDGAWLLATACGPIGHEEALAISTLIDNLPVPARIAVHDASFTDDELAWFAALPELEPAAHRALVEVLQLVAISDGVLRTPDRRFLKRVAVTLEHSIDFAQLERDAEALRRGGTVDVSQGLSLAQRLLAVSKGMARA